MATAPMDVPASVSFAARDMLLLEKRMRRNVEVNDDAWRCRGLEAPIVTFENSAFYTFRRPI